MIGSCDCCDRQNVPVKFYEGGSAGGVDATACYLCTGWGEPDPFCELEEETPVAKVMSTLGMFCCIGVTWFALVYQGMPDVV